MPHLIRSPIEHACNRAHLAPGVLCRVWRYTLFVFQRIQIAYERQFPLHVIITPIFPSLLAVVLLPCRYNIPLSLAIYCFCCSGL